MKMLCSNTGTLLRISKARNESLGIRVTAPWEEHMSVGHDSRVFDEVIDGDVKFIWSLSVVSSFKNRMANDCA